MTKYTKEYLEEYVKESNSFSDLKMGKRKNNDKPCKARHNQHQRRS